MSDELNNTQEFPQDDNEEVTEAGQDQPTEPSAIAWGSSSKKSEPQSGVGENTAATTAKPSSGRRSRKDTASTKRRWQPLNLLAAIGASAIVAAATSYGVVHFTSKPTSSPVVIKQVTASPTTLEGSGSSGSLNIPQILAKVEPAVVDITAEGTMSNGFFGETQFESAGTGMIISPNGLVLTNNHVIANATSIQATLFNQTKSHPVRVVGTDPAHDVAVLQIEGVSNLPTVTFGSSAQLQVGDPVIAIGNALALHGDPTVTQGIVSALHRAISTSTENLSDMIQTDAPINPGNSGGPLVNAAGQVVGMNTAIISSTGQEPAQNLGFAEAIDSVLPVVKNIEHDPTYYNKSSQPAAGGAFLGVGIQTLNSQAATQLGYSASQTGALIDYVYPGSPASQAGLTAGDVIVSFNGKAVSDASQLVKDVRGSQPGQQVTLAVISPNGSSTISVTLGTAPAT
jgi:S1-C subfamily serine protease